jgi:hypothetical protein
MSDTAFSAVCHTVQYLDIWEFAWSLGYVSSFRGTGTNTSNFTVTLTCCNVNSCFIVLKI